MDADVIGYLLAGDPAVRWQVLRDLTDADPGDVARERARVAREGWGAALLAEQAEDGRWDGGTYRPGWADPRRPFFDAWTATHFALQQLREFGVDPEDPAVAAAIDRVRQHVRWEHDDEAYFDGETEPCINGVALSAAVYFGVDGGSIVRTILDGQLPDGGWNCYEGAGVSSFHSTICALEGLRDQRSHADGDGRLDDALVRGEEYLLERRLLYRRTTGELVDPRFAMASYPVRWYYDALRALEYFRRADRRDARLQEPVEWLRGKRLANGMWNLENAHEGPTLRSLDGEGEGHPSRWVTLSALRVLRWWDRAAAGSAPPPAAVPAVDDAGGGAGHDDAPPR
ncbi:hypothetical protein AB3M83_11450 [Microbacterium sp. 179-B 1A2 NHS]|uniref:hypothetical protein n=1 Tax=Microbacterium sp. 179-B 1A2 NHS TaxID=3142383 RepID=UPI0039A2EE8A